MKSLVWFCLHSERKLFPGQPIKACTYLNNTTIVVKVKFAQLLADLLNLHWFFPHMLVTPHRPCKHRQRLFILQQKPLDTDFPTVEYNPEIFLKASSRNSRNIVQHIIFLEGSLLIFIRYISWTPLSLFLLFLQDWICQVFTFTTFRCLAGYGRNGCETHVWRTCLNTVVV